MKKIVCLLLAACMVFTLAACREKKAGPASGEQSPQEDRSDENEPAAQIVNPWRDVTEEEAKALCPQSFAVPDGAENAQWSVLESAADPSGGRGALVQLSFELGGNCFTAREQVTGDPEEDISGMYYDWTVERDAALQNWPDAACRASRWVGENEYADLCAWYDAGTGVSYTLGVTAEDLDGFDLLAIAEALRG